MRTHFHDTWCKRRNGKHLLSFTFSSLFSLVVFFLTHLGLQGVYLHFVLGELPFVQLPLLLLLLLGSVPLLAQLRHLFLFIPDRLLEAIKCTLAAAMMRLHRRQPGPGHVDLIVLLLQQILQILDLKSTASSAVRAESADRYRFR